MPRNSCLLLGILAYGMLVGVSYAIIGKYVRAAIQHEFPFIISISRRDAFNEYAHICTGTLISIKNVLTVAHCLLKKNTSDIEIIAGSQIYNQGRIFYAESWITYDEWKHGRKSDRPSLDDIAIIQIEGNGVLHERPPILPAMLSLNNNIILEYKSIAIASWGLQRSIDKPAVVKTAHVTVLPQEECNEKATALRGKIYILPPNFFCSQAEPWILSNTGDGGAPLMVVAPRVRQVVGINVGITPTVKNMSYTDKYLHEHLMNSHLRLAPYREFISQYLR